MTTKAEKDKAARAEVEEAKKLDEEAAAEEQATEEETSEQNVAGPVASPMHDPELVAAAGEEPVLQTAERADDGVEDVELGPPVVGQFVQITAGDYAGHFAAYIGNVEMSTDDPPVPVTIQVRTRDADNALIDVPYADVTSTTYSGGR